MATSSKRPDTRTKLGEGASAARATSSGAERKAFKLWFDEVLVDELGTAIAREDRGFALDRYRSHAVTGLDALEMMDRVGQMADALDAGFGRRGPGPLTVLVSTLPPVLESAYGVTEAGYRFWPYGEYIARYGRDHVDASFDAMVALTKRFTSEFAVRPFLADDVDAILDRMERLVDDPCLHVRRWVSEGTRTRLPWGKRVPALERALPRRLDLLERLHRDPERYVQRSVANHLQDILKDDVDAGLPHVDAWARSADDTARWVARHAARGLLKSGDRRAMEIFGYALGATEVREFAATPTQVGVGDHVVLRAVVKNIGSAPAAVRVDYVWTRPTASGGRGKGVFRWAERELEPQASVELVKEHPMVHRSTRRLVAGDHTFALQVNGKLDRSVVVTLLPDS